MARQRCCSVAGHRQRRAEQVRALHQLALAIAVRERRRRRRFDLRPRHARGQHRQRLARIDHLIQTYAKEGIGGHRQQCSISQELLPIGWNSKKFNNPNSPEIHSKVTGYGNFIDDYFW